MAPKVPVEKRVKLHVKTLAKLMRGEKGFAKKVHDPQFVFHSMNRSAVMLMAKEFGITDPNLKKRIVTIFNQATNQRLRGEKVSEPYFRSRIVKLVKKETTLPDKEANDFFSAVNGCLQHLSKEVPNEIGKRELDENNN